MKNKKAHELLKKYREGSCTDKEKEIVEYWLHSLNQHGESGLTEEDLIEAQDEIWNNIAPQRHSIQRYISQISVAAALLVFCLLGLFANYYFDKKAVKAPVAVVYGGEIKAGGNKAILTLANGKKIVLDDAANGKIAVQAGIKITKQADGKLIYTVADDNTNTDNKLVYNTIETPRGGQYQINLPDGSTVWLNAASSLRFPVRFNNNTREVELAGEGYFEIKHIEPVTGQSLPFLVKTLSPGSGRSGQTVEVLGTHFNINAYNDERIIKTTLLEGSVRVTASNVQNHPKMLKPGQQSVLSSGDISVSEGDTEAAIAWKNGYFRFNDESLESIMRKVSKWYNVDVVYQNEKLKDEPFSGITTRFANASELLRMLEHTDVVKFKIEANKIIVMDKNNH